MERSSRSSLWLVWDETQTVSEYVKERRGVRQKDYPTQKHASYDLMMKYIARTPNALESLKELERVRLMSKCQKSPYKYVCKWFEAKFPNYGKMVSFDEKGELVWKKEEDNKLVELLKASGY